MAREKIKKISETSNMNYDNLTKDQLIQELQRLKQQQKYGLVYKEHQEKVIDKCATHIPILVENGDRSILTEGQDHILIEGDNYPSLLALQAAYKNKVDVIYIDCPYNTGNKDFIYNDTFVDKEDVFRHSKWLSFMAPRLKLARELLSENGVIFVSIDDNEQAALKILCDKIFGENNFIDCLIWNKKDSPSGVPPLNMLVNVHEYILCYSNGKFKFNGVERSKDSFKNPDNDPRGIWRSANIRSSIKKDGEEFEIIDPKTGKKYKDRWAFSKDTLNKLIDNNKLIFPTGKKNQIRRKEFYNEFKNKNIPLTSFLGTFSTTSSSNEIKNFFGDNVFNYPKPSELIKLIIKQCNKNSIILDFFAGSGTTFQAVAELNQEDNGQRKCILITNNENNICRNITYKRCKKVIEGYTTPKNKQVEGTGGNLHYYKQEWVQADLDQAQMRINLKDHMTSILCMANDTFEYVDHNTGFGIYKNDKLTVAILKRNSPKYINSLKRALQNIQGPIKVYQTLQTGGTESDLHTQLNKKNITIHSAVDEYVKLYSHLTYQLRLKNENQTEPR